LPAMAVVFFAFALAEFLGRALSLVVPFFAIACPG
jgi:hypothetical protein